MPKTEAPFQVQFEEIDPARAQELLDTQPMEGEHRNRNLALTRVARYVEDLENGFWATTHQGLAIDENGILMDGQHRLKAIVESGKTALMMVSTGVPRETFTLMDGGYIRSAQSFLSGRYTTGRAALARTLLTLEECGGQASVHTIHTGKHPTHRILNFLSDRSDIQEYGKAFAPAAAKYCRPSHGKFVGTSMAGLLVGGFVAGRDNWIRWWEDVQALHDGGGVPEGNPVRALWRTGPAQGMTGINYMRAIRTGVALRDNQNIKMLREDMYRKVQVW